MDLTLLITAIGCACITYVCTRYLLYKFGTNKEPKERLYTKKEVDSCVDFICEQFDYNRRQAIRRLKDEWIKENSK